MGMTGPEDPPNVFGNDVLATGAVMLLTWSGAEPSQMPLNAVIVCRDKHGSVGLYLEACGFDGIEQGKLRSLLSPK